VAAGVGKMTYPRFVRFNVIGALVWGVGVTLLGSVLGRFDVVKNNIDVALVLVVAVSLIPIAVEWIKHRVDARKALAALSED
jgi:membrane-associated protein